MKKLKLSFILPILLGLFISSCSKESTTGSGVIISETRNHTDFNGVEIEGIIETIIEYGTEYSVEITCEDNVLEHVKTNVSNNLLTITMGTREYKNIEPVRLNITCPDIKEVSKHGVNKTTIKGFTDLTNLELNHHGVEDFILEGSAEKLTLEKSGVGNLLAFDFEVEEFSIEQNGVGETEIKCTSKMTGELNGVGNIYYKGQPTIDVEVNGVGSIRDAN